MLDMFDSNYIKLNFIRNYNVVTVFREGDSAAPTLTLYLIVMGRL